MGGARATLRGDIISPAVNKRAGQGEETLFRLEEVRPHVRRREGAQSENLKETSRQKT